MAQDRHRLEAFVAEALHGQRAEAFRQRLSVGADEQRVMTECRRRCACRFEQRHLHARVRDVIFAAYDVGDGEVDSSMTLVNV